MGNTSIHLICSLEPEYKLPEWDERRADWVKRANKCHDMEKAHEFMNDLEYLCLDWDKVPKTLVGPVTDWTVADVCEWLKTMPLSKDYGPLFTEQNIDGKTVSTLSVDQSKSFGITNADAKIIKANLALLEETNN